MGASTSTCRGLMQGTLVLFVLIFLVALLVAIVYWSGPSLCHFNTCRRVLMDVVLVVLSIAGLLYASYLLSNCRCEGVCSNECKLEPPAQDDSSSDDDD